MGRWTPLAVVAALAGCGRVCVCQEGEACVDGACHTLCAVDADCPGFAACSSGLCLEVAGAECGDAADCPAQPCLEPSSLACRAGRCLGVPRASGAGCDDADPCTGGDTCDGAGRCLGQPVVCNQPPPSQCLAGDTVLRTWDSTGACEAATGACVYLPLDTPCANCQQSCLQCLSDIDCEPGLFCSAGSACTPLLDDGGDCSLEGAHGCGSGWCDGALCCNAGDCCNVPADCPSTYGQPASCADTTAASDCQGGRVDVVCSAQVCASTSVDDDSACGGVVHECGAYTPVGCATAVNQAAPTCGTTCTPLRGCAAGFACDGGGQCLAAQGSTCVADQDCLDGLCECGDGDCSYQVCAAVGCDTCEYSIVLACLPGLGQTVPVEDPPGCAGVSACDQGVCRAKDGGLCSVDSECISDHCVCGDADCLDHRCAAAPCAFCEYSTDGQSCDGERGNIPCDDLLACTSGDRCVAGTCAGTLTCDTPPICHVAPGDCDAAGACDYVPAGLGAPCQSDGDPCTADQCDSLSACVHLPLADGAPCGGAGFFCFESLCQAGPTITRTFGERPASDYPGTLEETTLQVSGGPVGLIGEFNLLTYQDNQPYRIGLATMDVSAIPVGWTVSSATLELYLRDGAGTAPYDVAIHAIVTPGIQPVLAEADGFRWDASRTWTANMCCQTGAPMAQADIGPAIDSVALSTALGYRTWNITSMVQGWVDDPTTNRGCIVNADTSAVLNDFRLLSGSDTGIKSERPQLTVIFGP